MIETISRMSTAAVIRTTLDFAAPALRLAAAQIWRGAGLAQRYPEYLRVMHGVVRASVPLMQLAARRCAELGPGDPIAEPLRCFLDEHITHEREHDDWLLADLATVGADPARALTELPSPAVARLVGAQYYWINHHHPVALLGYIAVLEGHAPAPAVADWIMSTIGVPEAAVRTVREHAELDLGHTDAVFDLLDTLALTSAHAHTVAMSGLHTADALNQLFAHIVQTSQHRAQHDAHPTLRTDITKEETR